MISPDVFVREAAQRGFGLHTGVPCSFLKGLINEVIDSPAVRWVPATNEGDAVAIAAGAELGGTRSVVLLQNSGLGNAVNPLVSLTRVFEIPALLVITLRGDPEGAPDEPQHAFMGAITTEMLELLDIAWEWLPPEAGMICRLFDRVVAHFEERRTPFAFVVRKGTFATAALKSAPEPRPPAPGGVPLSPALSDPRPSRREVLQAVQANARPEDIIVATTGYTGRELYALEDRPNQLYMVGSMGCASSLGLGLALACPSRRVIVLDGDGALLMRLGALATVAYERPRNLLHIALDNEAHESTGGQSTVSHSVDFRAIAAACGYPSTSVTQDVAEIGRIVATFGSQQGPTFLHAKIARGTPSDLPRPTITPPEVARRLRAHCRGA